MPLGGGFYWSAASELASERAGKGAGHTQSKLTVYLRHPMGSGFDWSAANEQVREWGAINQSLLALHVGDGLARFAASERERDLAARGVRSEVGYFFVEPVFDVCVLYGLMCKIR